MKDENDTNAMMPFCCRVQKITEALYRVTELLPEKEPLKWQLRVDAVELFDFLILKERKEIFEAKNIFALIRRLARTLQLACASSAHVSSINFEVLRREYLSLSDSLENQIESEKNKIQSGEFAIENILPEEPVGLPEYNGQLITDKSNANGQPYVLNNHNGQKEKELIKVSNNGNNGNGNGNGNGTDIVLKERKRKILSLIKGGDWLSLREISDFLPEFGDKSIQRDLVELVNAGMLRKAGDKRWRKYALV